jgi:Domain of unknown function (DUF4261)
MTSSATSRPQTAAREPQYSSTVICGRYSEIRLTQLVAALRTIAPSSVMGDWLGPFRSPPTDALGTDMISVDGISLTLLNVDKALPPQFFDTGPIPNHLMPNPLRQLRNHQAHISVMPAQRPKDGPTAVATARAVTLLAWAVAVVTRAEAVHWTDSNNFAPVSLLQNCAPRLLPAGGIAVPLWIRILAGRAHGQMKIIAGSYGLWAFGLPEIEYAPTDLSIDYLVPHAYMVCDHIFRTDNALKHDDTIDVDGVNVFAIESLERGFFGPTRALRLSWFAASKSFDPSAHGLTPMVGPFRAKT